MYKSCKAEMIMVNQTLLERAETMEPSNTANWVAFMVLYKLQKSGKAKIIESQLLNTK